MKSERHYLVKRKKCSGIRKFGKATWLKAFLLQRMVNGFMFFMQALVAAEQVVPMLTVWHVRKVYLAHGKNMIKILCWLMMVNGNVLVMERPLKKMDAITSCIMHTVKQDQYT